MGAGSAGDECVGRVNGPPALLERSLVTAGAYGRFAPGLYEAQALDERGCGLALSWADASFDLGDVDAARSEPVPSREQLEQ